MSLVQSGLFWGIVLGYFVLLPQQTRLEHRLIRRGEYGAELSETSLDFVLLCVGMLAAVLLMVGVNYTF